MLTARFLLLIPAFAFACGGLPPDRVEKKVDYGSEGGESDGTDGGAETPTPTTEPASPGTPTPPPGTPAPDPLPGNGAGNIPTPPDGMSPIEDCSKVVDQCPVPGGVTWQCKKRYVHGVNYAWHNFGGDFGGIPGYGQSGVATTANDVDRELADMKAHGANTIRWWVIPDLRGAGVEFDAKGFPTKLGATFEKDLLKALELAEKNNIYLMLSIFSFDAFKPSQTVKGVYIRGLQPIITDASKRKALMENVIRPMAKIAESSPFKKRLMTWELINEPEWAMLGASKYGDPAYECSSSVYECVSHEQMETFLADITKVLRTESKALISVGATALKWKSAWTRLDLDYYQFHIYDWVNQFFPYTKSPKDWALTDKPIVMGEFPFSGVGGVSGTKLMESWYSNGFAGAMGWAVTDPAFNWNGNRAALKSFSEQRSCQTQF